jgi:hypothetical protein
MGGRKRVAVVSGRCVEVACVCGVVNPGQFAQLDKGQETGGRRRQGRECPPHPSPFLPAKCDLSNKSRSNIKQVCFEVCVGAFRAVVSSAALAQPDKHH